MPRTAPAPASHRARRILRLALARYQPFSIPGVSLSPVALADIAQLTADRTAVLASDPLNPQTFVLSVSGIRPETPGQAPMVTNVVTVDVERRLPGRTDDLGWEPAAQAAAVTPLAPPATTDTMLWTGFVELDEPPGDQELRLVIREFEIFRADDDSAWPRVGDFRIGRSPRLCRAPPAIRTGQHIDVADRMPFVVAAIRAVARLPDQV